VFSQLKNKYTASMQNRGKKKSYKTLNSLHKLFYFYCIITKSSIAEPDSLNPDLDQDTKAFLLSRNPDRYPDYFGQNMGIMLRLKKSNILDHKTIFIL
jgi:hypothetical protein